MIEIDLYSPWREGPRTLQTRTVGRERELDAIRAGARAFASGSAPLPVYLYGAAGIGKSHLLTLAIAAVEAVTPVKEVAIRVVPEDAVAMRSARLLFDVMMQGPERRPWLSWREPSPAPFDGRRRVVLFEDLDRQLRALGVQGRRELRRLLGDGPDVWIVGAGTTLPGELTVADEAFFAAFDPWPLEPLEDDEAGGLLDRMADESEHDATWRPTRRTLSTLAGGNPRTLIALGLARRRDRMASPTELMHRVVHEFTPQNRSKLRDLAPQAQRIVTHLAAAPRELGPTELANALESTATQMSVQARRLVDDGVLKHRSDGRQTWYRLADPVFRYWLEYRNARWHETRAGWVATLLASAHEEPTPAALEPLTAPWAERVRELEARLTHHRESVSAELAATARLGFDEAGLRAVVRLALVHGAGELLDAHLGKALGRRQLADLASVAALDRTLRTQAEAPRGAFITFVERGATMGPDAVDALRQVLARSPHGHPWSLRPAEKRAVAAAPFVRALFLGQGRLWRDPPLLEPDDVMAVVEPAPPDAAELLVAALPRAHAALVEHAARALHAAGRTLPRCPSPAPAPAAAPATWIAELLVATLEAPDANTRSRALGWLGAVATVEERHFARVLTAIERADVDAPDPHHQLALASLHARASERFEPIRQALPSAWADTCRDAVRLHHQLAEAESGDVHHELGCLAARIHGGPSPNPR